MKHGQGRGVAPECDTRKNKGRAENAHVLHGEENARGAIARGKTQRNREKRDAHKRRVGKERSRREKRTHASTAAIT